MAQTHIPPPTTCLSSRRSSHPQAFLCSHLPALVSRRSSHRNTLVIGRNTCRCPHSLHRRLLRLPLHRTCLRSTHRWRVRTRDPRYPDSLRVTLQWPPPRTPCRPPQVSLRALHSNYPTSTARTCCACTLVRPRLQATALVLGTLNRVPWRPRNLLKSQTTKCWKTFSRESRMI